jgi:hypothetical protein
MFIAAELLDAVCTYMENSDLLSMTLVCRDWSQTCTRHLSTHLIITVWKSFYPTLQLANFNNRSRRLSMPTRLIHVKSVMIDLNSIVSSALDFDELYELLDGLGHLRRLELAIVSQDRLDVFTTAFQDIRARLPRVKHLALYIALPDAQLYPTVYKHITDNYQLASLTLRLSI